MQELSTIKKFSELVAVSAKLGKKTVSLDYATSVALLSEINSVLLDIKTMSNRTEPAARSSNLDGGKFKN